MSKPYSRKSGEKGLSMRAKITLSLSAIAVMLLISSSISVLEYRKMSSYVSELIADDINSISVAYELSKSSSSYNLAILAIIGDDTSLSLPDNDEEYFYSHIGTLKSSMASNVIGPYADSVAIYYERFIDTSRELEDVLLSDFIDSRTWYFQRLEPAFDELNGSISLLVNAIYSDLKGNSEDFDSGFYRSIMPGIVAVGVCLLLIIMLLVFVLGYYVNPIYKMLDALGSYRQYNKKYTCTFEGDDQLSQLNESISELVNENQIQRRRIVLLKNKNNEL